MTVTIEHVLEEIRTLRAPDLRAVWQEVNSMILKLELSSDPTPTPKASREEVMAALDRLAGCTAGSQSLPRLLEDRQRERQREEADLQAYLARRPGRTHD